MPTLLKNQSAIQNFDPDLITSSKKATAVVTNTSSFFFYSNDPESVKYDDLADSRKFLNRVTVTGKGQVYTWHANIAGQTIKNCLLIYNPNNYAIQVKVVKGGTTNTPRNDVSDSEAWKSYFNNGQQRTLTIAAAGYGNLFLTDIVNQGRFGMIAELDIVKSGTTSPATVILFDLAYADSKNSGNATDFAPSDGIGRVRGQGKGYIVRLPFPTLEPTAKGKGYRFASGNNDDYFGTTDCVYITDPSGSASGVLEGGYGQIFNMELKIKNTTGTSRKFRVFMGSHGGNCFPFVYFDKTLAYYTKWFVAGKYVDIIESDTITNGATASINFQIVVPALSGAPYFIGARAM